MLLSCLESAACIFVVCCARVRTGQRYDLLRVRRAGRARGPQIWKYAYALETKPLLWGGKLKVVWALNGPRGGLEVCEDGRPVVVMADDDVKAQANYEEIHFDNAGYVQVMQVVPEPPREWGWRTRGTYVLPRMALPKPAEVHGMDGFTFFVAPGR